MKFIHVEPDPDVQEALEVFGRHLERLREFHENLGFEITHLDHVLATAQKAMEKKEDVPGTGGIDTSEMFPLGGKNEFAPKEQGS